MDAILATGQYTEGELLNLAADHDSGFDQSRFAEALAAIDRLPDSSVQPYGMSPGNAAALRERMHASARKSAPPTAARAHQLPGALRVAQNAGVLHSASE